MDNASFGMFGELDNYNDRREYEEWLDNMEDGDEYDDSDEDICGDYIPGYDDGEWIETDDDFAADYYGEEEFA